MTTVQVPPSLISDLKNMERRIAVLERLARFEIHKVGDLTDPVTVPFEGTWHNVDTPSSTARDACFWKNTASEVSCEGAIAGGPNGITAFTLPPGFRPRAQRIFIMMASGGVGYLEVRPTGEVVPHGLVGDSAGISFLDPIRFLAEA